MVLDGCLSGRLRSRHSLCFIVDKTARVCVRGNFLNIKDNTLLIIYSLIYNICGLAAGFPAACKVLVLCSLSLLRMGIGIADAWNPYGCGGRNPFVWLSVIGIPCCCLWVLLYRMVRMLSESVSVVGNCSGGWLVGQVGNPCIFHIYTSIPYLGKKSESFLRWCAVCCRSVNGQLRIG